MAKLSPGWAASSSTAASAAASGVLGRHTARCSRLTPKRSRSGLDERGRALARRHRQHAATLTNGQRRKIANSIAHVLAKQRLVVATVPAAERDLSVLEQHPLAPGGVVASSLRDGGLWWQLPGSSGLVSVCCPKGHTNGKTFAGRVPADVS